jgi:pimeloyl-ACP methyl ester carboxylesterase
MNTEKVVPEDLKKEYPFIGNTLTLESGHDLHYLAEGELENEPVLMVHGNPTWSYYYRNLVKGLKNKYRVIVPDHIGCGLSSKPQDYSYTLKEHINNLMQLYKTSIKPNMREGQKLNIIVHDWGGAIGLGFAGEIADEVGKVVILNTAAFTDTYIPKRISLCKLPVIGEPMVRLFNAFAWPATFMAVEKPLSDSIKKGYLYPYNNYTNRIATARFVRDIPMNKEHPTWPTLKAVEDRLEKIRGPKLILWGAKDFCFTTHFFERWKAIYPEAQSHLYNDGGHYILEDYEEDTLERISLFLSKE